MFKTLTLQIKVKHLQRNNISSFYSTDLTVQMQTIVSEEGIPNCYARHDRATLDSQSMDRCEASNKIEGGGVEGLRHHDCGGNWSV